MISFLEIHTDLSEFFLNIFLKLFKQDFAEFSREFMAKVDDVEKITGLEFFPNMKSTDKIRLQIRLHSNIWGQESWYNRLRSDFFGLKKK